MGALLALAVALAAAEAAPAAPQAPLTIDGAQVAPPREAPAIPRVLDLGRYGRAYEAGSRAEDVLRFQSDVEVVAEAPPDFNATMAVWWRHFDFEYSIYGRGYDLPAGTTPSVNLMPLVDWAARQVRNYRRNRPSEQPASE